MFGKAASGSIAVTVEEKAMRFSSIGIAIAVLLAAGTASAAGGTGGRGETGGKGGTGPGGATQAGSGDVAPTVATDTQASGRASPDKLVEDRGEPKPWELGATWETHRLIRQEDIGGAGASKVFNLVFFSGRYDITDKDRVSMSWGLYQRFLADDGETGFRGTDITLAYTRLIPLPERFALRVTPSTTIPVSFYSQLASSITSPGLALTLSRKFGDLNLDARVSGTYFIVHYTTSGDSNQGGSPNAKARLGGSLTAEYAMPFHRALSLGASLINSYYWYYEPAGGCVSNVPCTPTTDSQFPTGQTMQQSYGGEIFARYLMPTLMGFKSDVTVALANGDPSLGYPGALQDGVVHPYLFYRQTAELYGALSLRY
jgi:hypothetical protein